VAKGLKAILKKGFLIYEFLIKNDWFTILR
jgi:hypothetical protein